MTIYTVHAPDGDASAVDELELVKEGFCWPALFVPVLWMLYRRQWLGLIAYAFGLLAVSFATYAIGANETMQTTAMLLYGVLVAMHANDWRRWRLEAHGCKQAGVVSGRNQDEAELRWFSHWHADTAPSDALVAATTAPERLHRASKLTPFATPFDPV